MRWETPLGVLRMKGCVLLLPDLAASERGSGQGFDLSTRVSNL